MKKAFKKWLLKEELAELKEIKRSLTTAPQVIDLIDGALGDLDCIEHSDLLNLPNEEDVQDMIDNSSFLTHDEVSCIIEDSNFVTEEDFNDLYRQESSEVLKTDDLDEFLEDYLTKTDAIVFIENTLETVLPDAIHESVKQAVTDLPGYFLYEQIKRYIKEDEPEVKQILEFDDDMFFAKFKDSMERLIKESKNEEDNV